MNRSTCITLAALALLVLAGCSMSRPEAAQPAQPSPVAQYRQQVEALKEENEALKQQQSEYKQQLAELQANLESQQAEHRRFQETMRTNFDLLEQSVAETLSQQGEGAGNGQQRMASAQNGAQARPASASTWDKQPVAAPAAVRASKSETGGPSEQANGGSKQQEPPVVTMFLTPDESKDQGSGSGSTAQTDTTRQNATGQQRQAAQQAAGASAMTAAAAVPQQKEGFNDPDLTPPEEPRELAAHPEAQSLYERGFGLFARQRYEEAVEVYTSFLERFPNDNYSDNAQFWIAESHRRMGNTQAAEAGYRAVLRQFEHRSTLDGFKTPDAILRIGQMSLNRGEPEKARYYFANAAERFPDSSAGRKAEQELESLRRNTADLNSADTRS